MRKRKLNKNPLPLEESLPLLYGDGNWLIRGVPSLKLPPLRMRDGPLGIRNVNDDNDWEGDIKPTICYPAPCLTACSFNKELLFKFGEVLGKEARHNDINLVLAPGVNIKRNPLCGRNFEYYSEDPYLAGKLASSFINGIQSVGIGSSLKHFACNSQETSRMSNDSIVDERALFEIYLKPFEIAIKEASPWMVMCSYNKINGQYASNSSFLLKEVLRDKWNYQGVVISDWGATSDFITSHNDGLDVEMPCLVSRYKDLEKAYKRGALNKDDLNKSTTRIVSLLEKSNNAKKIKDDFDKEEAKKLSLDLALDSMVLLKNEGVLPLKSLTSTCVIGSFAEYLRFQGGGSSKVKCETPVSFLDVINEDRKKKIPYSKGYSLTIDNESDLEIEAIDLAAKSKNVILFLGLPEYIESEGKDRENMLLPDDQLRLFDSIYSVNQNIIVVLGCGAPVELPFKDKAKAILLSYLPGEMGAVAIKKILLGEVSPSGRLAETWPKHLSEVPSFGFYPGVEQSLYRESIYVGYRYYLSANRDVNYIFGSGLSYAKFKYGKITLSNKEIKENEEIEVSIDIQNTSKIDSSLSICLYIESPKGNVFKPNKWLADFSKDYFKIGEAKSIKFKLPYSCFCFYDTKSKSFKAETGVYQVQICGAADEVMASSKINLVSNDVFESNLLEMPIYYSPKKDGFLQYDNDFEHLLGRTVPLAKDPKSRPYSLDSTIGDIKKTFIGKKIYKIGVNSLLKGGWDKEEAIYSIETLPIRNVIMQKGVKDKMPYFVVNLANGHYIWGLIYYLFNIKKNVR